MLSRLDVPGVAGDEDAAPLTATVWLADIRAGFPLATIGLEVPIAMCREGLVRRCLLLPALQSTLLLEPSVSDLLFFDQLKLSFHFHPLRHSRPQGQSLEGTEMTDPFLPRASQPGSQADSLCGEAPGARGEVVVQRVELLHTGEVPSQEVLPADFRHAREVVDFLKRSQAVILLPGGSGSAWGLGSPEISRGRARSR